MHLPCPVRSRFIFSQAFLGSSKSNGRDARLASANRGLTKPELVQLPCQAVSGSKSNSISRFAYTTGGFFDINLGTGGSSRSSYSGMPGLLTNFWYSCTNAVCLLIAEGAILFRGGSHSVGVDETVPVTNRIVSLSKTSSFFCMCTN